MVRVNGIPKASWDQLQWVPVLTFLYLFTGCLEMYRVISHAVSPPSPTRSCKGREGQRESSRFLESPRVSVTCPGPPCRVGAGPLSGSPGLTQDFSPGSKPATKVALSRPFKKSCFFFSLSLPEGLQVLPIPVSAASCNRFSFPYSVVHS